MSLLLLASAAVAQPAAPSMGPSAAAPPIQLPAQAAWPPARPLEVIRQPDWGDYDIYPQAARRRDQEGAVASEILVGKDGVPTLCRILASSGYAELDAGSCALMLTMRFAPPRDEAGKSVEASRALRIVWVLTDPTPLVYGHLGIDVMLDKGAIVGCATDELAVGVPPRQWRTACQELAAAAEAILGEQRYNATRMRVSLAIVPDGAVTRPSPPITVREISPSPWRLVAERRTRFTVNGKGDPSDCRHVVDRGIGTPREDHAGRCGLFLNGSWFRTPKDPAKASADFELRVYASQVPGL